MATNPTGERHVPDDLRQYFGPDVLADDMDLVPHMIPYAAEYRAFEEDMEEVHALAGEDSPVLLLVSGLFRWRIYSQPYGIPLPVLTSAMREQYLREREVFRMLCGGEFPRLEQIMHDIDHSWRILEEYC